MTITDIRPLTEGEALYLAGLLEGEGCFDAQGTNPRIRVKMTDLDIIIRAATLMGTSYYGDPGGLHKGHKMAYVAQVTGARAAYIMRTILPHLGVRRGAKVTEHLAAYDSRGRRLPLTLVPTKMAA